MLANQVDDGYSRPARVVEICETIAQTRTEMQQRACRFLCHASIAIHRSGRNSFEQRKHTPHFGDSV
jgi:hypothetical protein